MKKLFLVFALLFLAVVVSACGKKEEETKYYFAADDSFSRGYRYYVVVEKKGDEITNVEWNGYHVNGGASSCLGDNKATCAEKGNYGMNAALGTWDVQAKAAATWVVENQKLDVTFDEDGNADAVTTVSIHTKEMFDLINEALAADPIAKGEYKEDGFFYIETEKGSKTSKFAEAYVAEDGTVTYLEADGSVIVREDTYDTYTFGTFVIVNGTIVLADFNATQNAYEYILDENSRFVKYDNGTPDDTSDDVNTILMVANTDAEGNVTYSPKSTFVTKDAAGDWYGMSKIGKVEWNKQVEEVEKALLENQSLTFTDKGIDGVTSVSISVGSFDTILKSLEEQAK